LAYARGEFYRRLYRTRGKRVVIGRFFSVWGSLEIRGPGTVIFGDHCNVISSRMQPTTIFTHHPDAVIRFGDRVQLTGTRFGCERSIEIGDMAGLSDARIMDTDFHALEVYDQPRYNTRGVSKPIVMERNVWIGAGAMVLKGVRVGRTPWWPPARWSPRTFGRMPWSSGTRPASSGAWATGLRQRPQRTRRYRPAPDRNDLFSN
jgi:acetyltransferase-like isoleucine patch superfamily enzyme